MLDFHGDYTRIPSSKIRFGQWKVPFNAQEMTSSGKLQMIDRSEADEEFSLGRQLGAMIYGEASDERLEYYLGLWNGNSLNETRNDNNEHLWIFRTAYNPFGLFGEDEGDVDYSEKPLALIAGAIAFDGEDDATFELEEIGEVTADEIDTTRVVGELGFKYKGFSILNEYYWRKRHGTPVGDIRDQGFFTQAGYFLIPKRLEVAGRYSLVDFDDELESEAIRGSTLGVNYFFDSHRNKLQFNAVRLDEEAEARDAIDYRYALPYQMSF